MKKLTIQDLTDLLAAKHSMTKKDAEAFVREFFLLIEQALESDKAVKIKGLGTFKLVDVDSRESVNVNTGERFQIKGHTKVTFSPDTSLRDTINKPFAHFETVVLNENTILEDTPIEDAEEEEADEEIQAPAVKVQTPVVEEKSPAVETQTAAIEEKKEEPQKNVEQQPEEQPQTETSKEEKIEQEESRKEAVEELELKEAEEEKEEEKEIIVAEQHQQPEQPAKEEEKITAEQIIKQELQKANLKPELPKKDLEQKESTKKESTKEKSPVPYLITVIVIVLLLCGSVVLFIYYPDLFSSSADDSTLEMPSVTTQPIQTGTQLTDTIEYKDTVKEVAPDVPVATIPQPVAKKEEVNTPAKNTPAKDVPAKTENEVDKKQPSASVYLDSVPYKITGTKTKYTIKEGETLTRVSLRFYGTKAMWPYIVKHNPKIIKNPDNVPYGTTIEIPELTKE